VRQLPWVHNRIIFGQCKRREEREFYLRLAAQEHWAKRELERQINGAMFERAVLHPAKVSPAVRQIGPEAASVFKDACLLEFLDWPANHAEADLHTALLRKLKDFLIELGRDFCFVGSQYPVQVGDRDFALDLLFFHRGLNSLIAVELKVGRFEPEYIGKLAFYLEALDRDVKKPHERPSIGVLLCASKNDEVVEYALSRTLSPALIAGTRHSCQIRDCFRPSFMSSTFRTHPSSLSPSQCGLSLLFGFSVAAGVFTISRHNLQTLWISCSKPDFSG
jgi:predicted nuclease of restriction endonuclease-like (RecB) superfamily